MRSNAAVIGSPISHSLSPEIFGFLGTQVHGMNLNYRAIEVTTTDLRARLIEFTQDSAFVGSNVTAPNKEAVMKIADHSSPLAKAVGAANVLHLKEGQWIAHNTDVFGISESLREAGFQFYQANVLILGAGGAARAAVAAVAQESATEIDIYNRTHARAQALTYDLATHFPKASLFAVKDLHELSEKNYDLVIQSTSLGMQGTPSQAEAEIEFKTLLSQLHGRPLAFDLIYRPEITEFLKVAQLHSWSTLGGLSMLAHQAIATWKIWFPNMVLPIDISSRLIDHLRYVLSRGEVRR